MTKNSNDSLTSPGPDELQRALLVLYPEGFGRSVRVALQDGTTVIMNVADVNPLTMRIVA
jgi:hypothetical protein